MRLTAGDWDLTLAPDIGGAIASLRRRGRDVLRPTPDRATEPFAFACFAMVPYANRIADGRFEAGGVAYRLAPNHAGQDHPLHGVSWLNRWQVAASDAASATLVHRHPGDETWAWAYRAEQRIELDDAGLSIALTLTNEADRAMPASLGFHPYFASPPVTSLRFGAEGVWMRDERCLPTTLAAADSLGDWAAGETVRRRTLIDNSYIGWPGTARIARSDGDLLLSGRNTPVLHLYTPPGEDHFCVEPATSMPDAFNRATPLMLRPGEHQAIGMTIRTAPSSSA